MQPLQRGLLDLSHPLGAHPQRSGDLPQRPLRGRDPKARADNGSFTVSETAEQPRQLAHQNPIGRSLIGLLGPRIGEQLPHRHTLAGLPSGRLVKPPRSAFAGQQTLHMTPREPGRRRELPTARRDMVALFETCAEHP